MLGIIADTPLNDYSILALIMLGLVVLFIYFLPSIIASGKKNSGIIFLLNLFLGATGVVWLVLLIWAISSPKKST